MEMESSAIKEFNDYWKNFFNQEVRDYNDVFNQMPSSVKQYFDFEYLPEPFYGYLTEDMKEDVVLLLLNPGGIDIKVQQQFFNSTAPETLIELSNGYVKNRHLKWSKTDYIKNEQFNYPGREWRRKKLSQCEKIVGHPIPFLHTVELFPFHSKNWIMKKNIKEDWLYELKSTQLFVNAIEAISKNKSSKYILGIGKDWIDVLSRFPEKFYLANNKVIVGPKGGRAHSIYQFKLVSEENALPIIIYSGVSMNLPVNDVRALQVFKEYLEINR